MKKPLYGFYLTALCLSLLISSSSNATTYYVDPSSTSTIANGTLANPWKTIAQVNAGATVLYPGDMVLFKRGQSYSGRLNVPSSGTAASPITYGNYGTGALPEFNNAITDIIRITNKQYVVIDGIKIVDNSISTTDHSIQANISYAIILDNSPNCTIKNCDISLVGVGISTTSGSNNTMITGNYFHNMRMVRNTPTYINSNDDYGANPMVIGSSYNTISYNRFEECWALSYDYGFDGGAVELFGSSINNNNILYNTAINCDGFMEVGSSSNGVCNDNVVAYNKIINCVAAATLQNSGTFNISINNLQYYNNTFVETVLQYEKSSNLFWMSGTGNAGMVVVKNNIFWLSSGVNVAQTKFNSGQMIHSNNIYRMTSGTVGLTLNSTELLSNSATLFSSTSGAPSAWDLHLSTGSPAINFGTGVGFSTDFDGKPVSGNPDAGILEYISASTAPLTAAASAGTILCNTGTTTVTITATGGTPPYTGTGNFTVTAGTYSYTVTDASGSKSNTSITVTQPAAIVETLTAGSITTAGGTTSITATATGGTGTYLYSLNGGSFQTSNVFSNVTAGTYTITVKDANNCTVSKSITITQPAPLVASATAGAIACNGGTATVTVSATGGISPYTGTGSFTVSAGSYTYTVTDAAGNKASTSITVSQPVAISVTLTAASITNAGGTTSITTSAAGGTGTYMYSLNGGSFQSSNIFSNVTAGTYTVTVRDANNCTVSKSITITEPATFVASSAASTIACNGGTATVTVSASGGVSPYTGTGNFTVTAGTYTYTVTDAAGNKASTSITVSQPNAIIETLSAGNITTAGGSTSITVSATGGTGSYSYSLNGGSFQSSTIFSNVTAGTYTVTVKDANNCTVSKSVTITQPAALVASSTAGAIACNGGTTTVTVSASGGVSPYTGTGNFTVTAGSYTYTVTDAAGNKASTTITVTQPTPIVETLTAGNITTAGGSTSITVNATGGSGSYLYSLNGGSFQSSNTFSKVTAGTYTVTVKDANGCMVSQDITLTEPLAAKMVAPLTASATAGTILCNGSNTTVTVSATGGVTPYKGTGNYTVTAGTYTYTVTDAAGASASISITVGQPTALSVTLSAGTITTTGGTTSITVNASGGTGTYLYSLNGGSFQASNIFNNVSAGTYTVTVKDANACTASQSISLADPVIKLTTTDRLKIRVYPNPSTTYFTLSISKSYGNDPVQLVVHNTLGMVIYQAKGTANQTFTFGGSFAKGSYFLTVIIGNAAKTVQLLKQ